MDETSYKIWAWGEPTREGRNEQYNVGIRAKAKISRNNDFETANELFCMRLGQVLKLPIPTGVLLEKDGEKYFASLHFSTAPQRLPPTSASKLEEISQREWLSCGIITFDSWILNEDRTPSNMSYYAATGEVQIFDHGAAFYDHTHGAAYFDRCRHQLCIRPQNHCLAGRIRSLSDFDEWHTRIMQIPEYFIKEVLQAVEVGLPPGDVAHCLDFILERRMRLKDLFRHELHEAFPNLVRTLFDPFAGPQELEYCI